MGAKAALASPKILVLTHSDNDHIGGFRSFAEILRRLGNCAPEEVWVPADRGYAAAAIATARMPSTIGRELENGLVRDITGLTTHDGGLETLFEEGSPELEALGRSVRRHDQAHGRVSRELTAAELAAAKADDILCILDQAARWHSTVRYFNTDG